MDAAEIARKAADYIRVNGHVKYQLWNEQGSACFQGAICAALLGKEKVEGYSELTFWDHLVPLFASDESVAITETATGIIAERGWGALNDFTVCDPITYNNHPSTTPEDVIYLLELTAKELDDQPRLPG